MKKVLLNFVGIHDGSSYPIDMSEILIASGYQIEAIISKNSANYETWKSHKGINAIGVNGYTNYFNYLPRMVETWFQLKKINKTLCKNDIKCMYIPGLTFWTYFIQRIFKGYKYIYTMHDPILHNRKHPFLTRANIKLAQNADKVIILSESFRQTLITKYKINNSKICVIPHGYQSGYKLKVSSINESSNRIHFLFQGRIDQYKGLQILAQAYKKLSEENSNVDLTIAGMGNFDSYKSLYDGVQRFDLQNRWLSNDEVSDLFSMKRTVVVVPYISATQSGVIPVAMACGNIIIASKCGGIVEQIKNNENGLLIEPNDVNELYQCMKKVAENYESYTYLGENAKREIAKIQKGVEEKFSRIFSELGE